MASFFADANGQNFGSAVAFADLTGDGKPEVIIGADEGDNSADGGRGFVSVIDGSDLSTEVCRATGTAPDEHLGARLAAGEVTIASATVPIFVAGAWGVNNGSATQAGAVRAFAYDATATPKCQQLWENLGTGSTDFYGSSIAIAGGLILAGGWGADLGGSATANIGYVRLLDGATGTSLAQFNGSNPHDEMGRGVAFGEALNASTLIPGYIRVFDGATGTELFRFSGAEVGERFGYAVGAAVIDNGAGKANVAGGAYWGFNAATTWFAGSVRIFASPP